MAKVVGPVDYEILWRYTIHEQCRADHPFNQVGNCKAARASHMHCAPRCHIGDVYHQTIEGEGLAQLVVQLIAMDKNKVLGDSDRRNTEQFLVSTNAGDSTLVAQ